MGEGSCGKFWVGKSVVLGVYWLVWMELVLELCFLRLNEEKRGVGEVVLVHF